MQKFKEIYDQKSRNEIINEAISVLDIPIEESYKNESFGSHLKITRFHGRFLNKQEVEEFIKTVVEESHTIAKDLVEQCSQRTFKACYDSFSKIYDEPTEDLASKIVKYDPRTVSNSDFSLWIRARFIQEIFKRGLEEEALKGV